MKNSIVEIKLKIENSEAKKLLDKLLTGRQNWSRFFKQYANQIKAGDVISFDVIQGDKNKLKLRKHFYSSSLKKVRVHYAIGRRKTACGNRSPVRKSTRDPKQVSCESCRVTKAYREAPELRPIKNMISILRQI